jgi:intein/homing endonuclease
MALETSSLANRISPEEIRRLAGKVSQAVEGLDSRSLESLLSYTSTLSEAERECFLRILDELRSSGHSTLWKAIWQLDFHTLPVSVSEWIDDPYYMGPYLSRDLYPVWREELAYVFSSSSNVFQWAITGSLGSGKCSHHQSLCQSSFGLLHAGELASADGGLLHSESGPREIVARVDEGEQDSVRIETHSGSWLENSPHHRHRVLTDGFEIAWRRADEIRTGDFIVRKPGDPRLWGDRRTIDGVPLGTDFALLVGLWVAEGHYIEKNSRQVHIHSGEDPEDVEDIVRRGLPQGDIWSSRSRGKQTHVTIHDGKFAGVIRSHLKTGSRRKCVPRFIREAPREVVAAFLRGYCGGDGGVSGNAVEISTASRLLADEVKEILWCFGIHSVLREKSVRLDGWDQPRTYWRTHICGKWHKIAFQREIGFAFERKNRSLGLVCDARVYHRDKDREFIPHESYFAIPKEYRSKRHPLYRRLISIYRRGHHGPEHLHPLLRRILDEGLLFDPVVSVARSRARMVDFQVAGDPSYVANGAISHNTFVSLLALLYKVYVLTCHKDPQNYYGLATDSEIVFGIFNVILDNALRVGFSQVARFVKRSGYFRDHAPAVIRESACYVRWPSKEIVLKTGSSELHALGQNLLSVFIDEANLMKTPKEKKEEEMQAYRLYAATVRRAMNRFQRLGHNPGICVIASSRTHESSFLENLMRLNKTNPQFHVSDYAVWDTKGRHLYSPTSFRVVIGDRHFPSRIVDEVDTSSGDSFTYTLLKRGDVQEGERSIEVPADFYYEFLRDVEGSIRDIAGQATYGMNSLIWHVPSVHACIDSSRRHPFLKDVHELSMDDPASSLLDVTLWDDLHHADRGVFSPLHHPTEARFVHCDLGLTGDACGIACGCGYDYAIETKQDQVTGELKDHFLPKIWVDFMLRIEPVRGEKIDLLKIVEFILNLPHRGFHLQRVTFDGFASEVPIEMIEKANLLPSRRRSVRNRFDDRLEIEARVLSVDRDAKAYRALRDLLFQHAISFYRYPPLLDEIFHLEYDQDANSGKGKVDHPPQHSKDVADALAGMVWSICTAKSFPIGEPTGEELRPAPEETVADELSRDIVKDYPLRDRVSAIVPPPEPRKRIPTGREGWRRELEDFDIRRKPY